jgi:hypothetical protein
MKKPQDYGKPFGVINVAIVIVIAFYLTIGFLGIYLNLSTLNM